MKSKLAFMYRNEKNLSINHSTKETHGLTINKYSTTLKVPQ